MEGVVLMWRLQKWMKSRSAAPYLLGRSGAEGGRAGKAAIIRLEHQSRCER